MDSCLDLDSMAKVMIIFSCDSGNWDDFLRKIITSTFRTQIFIQIFIVWQSDYGET